eukprot:Em0001g436a
MSPELAGGSSRFYPASQATQSNEVRVDLEPVDAERLNAMIAAGGWRDVAVVMLLKATDSALTRCLEAQDGVLPSFLDSVSTHALTFTRNAYQLASDVMAFSHQSGPVVVVSGVSGSGKSTLCRFLVNYLLNRHPAVGYLECDVGQTEFTVPGVCALHVVREPLLGPPYTHPQKASRAYYYGGKTPKDQPGLYGRITAALFEHFMADVRKSSPHMPLIVNSCGWLTASSGEGEVPTQAVLASSGEGEVPTQAVLASSGEGEVPTQAVLASSGEGEVPTQAVLASSGEGEVPTQAVLASSGEGEVPMQAVLASSGEGEVPTQAVLASSGEGEVPTQAVLASSGEGEVPTQAVLASSGEGEVPTQAVLASSGEGEAPTQAVLALAVLASSGEGEVPTQAVLALEVDSVMGGRLNVEFTEILVCPYFWSFSKPSDPPTLSSWKQDVPEGDGTNQTIPVWDDASASGSHPDFIGSGIGLRGDLHLVSMTISMSLSYTVCSHTYAIQKNEAQLNRCRSFLLLAPPKSVSWSSVAVHVLHRKVPSSQLLYALNGRFVALGCVEEEECLGRIVACYCELVFHLFQDFPINNMVPVPYHSAEFISCDIGQYCWKP